jgi:rSAM/selenodomain-associated transferase 2
LISVIIPVLNEEAEITDCLRSLEQGAFPMEVLVVDGGSQDATCERAEKAGARVLRSPPGRAQQMNFGAEAAEGDVLLFLHVDLRLPPGGVASLVRCMEDPEVSGGGFFKRYLPTSFTLGLVAWLQNWIRASCFGDLVGTNAMFLRTGVFRALGGFPEVPLLEDVLLSDRLKGVGKLALVRDPVVVSSRKYRKDGAWKRTLKNLWIMTQFRLLGRGPEELVRQYRGG